MIQIAKFKWVEFEWDENNVMELEGHSITSYEAEECFYNRHEVFRNKKKRGRQFRAYKLHGMTDAGRRLLLIFFVKEKSSVRSAQGAVATIRVITGWEV